MTDRYIYPILYSYRVGKSFSWPFDKITLLFLYRKTAWIPEKSVDMMGKRMSVNVPQGLLMSPWIILGSAELCQEYKVNILGPISI